MINYFDEIQNLKINRQGTVPSVHKPLLLLLAISEIMKGRSNKFSYNDIESRLAGLIKRYSLTESNSINPQYPFIYLANSVNLWICSVDKKNLKYPDSANRSELENAIGFFPEPFYQYLLDGNGIEIIRTILKSYWPFDKHQLILSDLGLGENINDLIAGLSERAKKMLNKLGGIEKTLEYFKENRNFLNIPRAGDKTNFELILLCEHLIVDQELINPPIKKVINKIVNPINIHELIDIYLIKKKFTTTRLKNYLNNKEQKEKFEQGYQSQVSFLIKYFIEDYNFINDKNLGAKTVEEVLLIRNELRAKTIYTDSSEVELINIPEPLNFKLFRNFDYTIPIDKLDKVIINNGEKIDLPLLLRIYIHYQKYSSRLAQTLSLVFYSNQTYSLDSIAETVQCTKERARQMIAKINDIIIPEAINYILLKLNNIPYQLSKQGSDVIELFDSDFSNNEFHYNTNFLKSIYAHLNENPYFDLNEIIEDSKSFVQISNTILISVQFSEKVHFIELIDFLDIEIFNFETIEFEYDRKVLINRFYDENDLVIVEYDLNFIDNLINRIIRNDWSDIASSITRNKKRKEREDIYNLIHDFILEKNEPQKTKFILEFLLSINIEISNVFLLHILNKNSSRFQRLGNGYWTITEFNNNVHGSLREIIQQKLFESERPLHISEIHSYVNSLRPISEHSIRSNLKMEEDKLFIFFNCSYIGLSSKQYDKYWYDLPRFNGTLLNQKYLNSNNLNTDDDILDHFTNKLHYPLVHILYIMSERNKSKE